MTEADGKIETIRRVGGETGFSVDRVVCVILRGFDPGRERDRFCRRLAAPATPFNSAGKQSCANSAISTRPGNCHANAVSPSRRAN